MTKITTIRLLIVGCIWISGGMIPIHTSDNGIDPSEDTTERATVPLGTIPFLGQSIQESKESSEATPAEESITSATQDPAKKTPGSPNAGSTNSKTKLAPEPKEQPSTHTTQQPKDDAEDLIRGY